MRPQNHAPLPAAGVRRELLQGLFAPRTEKWNGLSQSTRIALVGCRNLACRVSLSEFSVPLIPITRVPRSHPVNPANLLQPPRNCLISGG